jgi:hypothetical protein
LRVGTVIAKSMMSVKHEKREFMGSKTIYEGLITIMVKKVLSPVEIFPLKN